MSVKLTGISSELVEGRRILSSTLEMNAVKRIMREGWESELKEKGTNVDILNDHCQYMLSLGFTDYEGLPMQNIAKNANRWSRGQVLAYTQFVEALAIGYKNSFGITISKLLIAGVTLIAKDVKAISTHYNYFVTHVSKGSSSCLKKIEREVQTLEKIKDQLSKKNSGILRFLRKNEIKLLLEKKGEREEKVGKLQKKKMKLDAMSDSMRVKISPHQGKA